MMLQMMSKLIVLSTENFAYFFMQKQNQPKELASGTVWCVCIQTKKSIIKHNEVKTCQKQGEGLVLVNSQGIIHHIGRDFKSQGLVSQVIGFTADWFNQWQIPLKALQGIDFILENNLHCPIVHIYLPYAKEANLTCNILYYPDKQKMIRFPTIF